MRKFTVIGPVDSEAYIGFSRLKHDTDSIKGVLIAAVWFEGEPEMYSLDNVEAVETLRQYYVNGYGEQEYKIVIAQVL